MMNLLGIQEMKNVFKAAVESVKPSKLIGSQIKCVNNTVHIGEEIKIQVNQNCHVIGALMFNLKVFLKLCLIFPINYRIWKSCTFYEHPITFNFK